MSRLERTGGGLLVRLVAPLKFRLDHLAESQGVDRDEAERLVRRHDRAETGLVRYLLHREFGDPLLNDRVLNAARNSRARLLRTLESALLTD